MHISISKLIICVTWRVHGEECKAELRVQGMVSSISKKMQTYLHLYFITQFLRSTVLFLLMTGDFARGASAKYKIGASCMYWDQPDVSH